MNKPLIALALCVGLTAAAPAAAQYGKPIGAGSGSQDGAVQAGAKLLPNRDTTESMESYGKLLKYADCLMGNGQSAESILNTKPNSRSERNKTGLLRQRVKTCEAKGVENIHSLVRGALAEAMYVRQVKQLPVVDAARAQAFIASEKAFHDERDKGDQVMATVINCMVATSPDKAHGVLAAKHGTAQESTAMDAFFAASQKCGAGASRPQNLSRSFIRAFLADAAWRYARAAR